MRWRKATWALLLWTGLAILLMYVITQAAGDVTAECIPTSGQEVCQAATAIAGGLWIVLISFVWFIGFIVLSIIWFMSRPARRLCPACGTQAKKGAFICTRCGYDFRVAAMQAAPAPGPPTWGQSQQPPGGPPPAWGPPSAPGSWPSNPSDPTRRSGPR